MRPITKLLASTTLFLASGGAAIADAVLDWNLVTVNAAGTAGVSPDRQSRALAIVHVAMFEAVNSIAPRYAPYRARLPAEPGASPEAAAAVAAHTALVRLFPAQSGTFAAALRSSLAAVPDGPRKAGGIRLGEQAAAAMLAERAGDGSDAPDTYRPFTVAGRWVPTAPPASSTWGSVRPFAMQRPDQFRPPAPYALTSAEWSRDFNEIKAIGGRSSTVRTPAQTEIARFWQLTGTATYNPVTRQVAATRGLDLLDHARLFALSAIATADAAVAVFDAKYAYGFWRPVTAIRLADTDGNDATEADAGWTPFIPTPMHPEYPCAHCIFQGAAAGVLRTLYGDTVPTFTLTSTTAPGIVRSFQRLSDYVADVVDGRVFEGVHFRTSGEVGAAMGRAIAEHTVATQLRPLH